ncbi:MAG: hypothetical protein RL375_2656 [Pseudomonadota bacterium]
MTPSLPHDSPAPNLADAVAAARFAGLEAGLTPSAVTQPWSPQRWHGPRVIVAMALTMSGLVLTLALVAAWELRERTRSEWADQLSTVSLMMAEQVTQTMFSAHTVLDSIDVLVRSAGIDSDAGFRQLAAGRDMHELLVNRTSGHPVIDVATLVANDGQVLNFTRGFPAPPINLAERDYFRAHGADPALVTFTSAPVRNKGNGQWVFYISRAVRDGRGQLLGLILVGVSVEWFSQFYERVGTSLGDGASLSLWRSDFTLMTRWPFAEAQVGQVMRHTGTYQMVAQQQRDHGIVTTDGPGPWGAAADLAHMAAPRVVARYPFIVTPVITEDFYLASWRRSVAWIGLTAAVSLVLVGVGMRSLLAADRQLRRELHERVQAQDSLRAAHEQLERRVAERTADLRREIGERERAQQALTALNDHIAHVSHRAGMAEVANSVLHNVGNVLNSVNVAVTLIGDQVRQSALADLPRAVALLQAHEHDLPAYLGHDPQGRQLPAFLGLLAEQWQREHQALGDETARLTANVQHIKDIVSRQQSLSGLGGLVSLIDLPALIDDVLALHAAALQRAGLQVQCEHTGPTQWHGDRSKLTQILLNLVVNAEEATLARTDGAAPRRLIIRSSVADDQRLRLVVQDNGCGLAPDAQARLFAYGYTTKPTGHGFGLHASAIAAQEMGGSLSAHSDGAGQGATFTLSLPDGASRQTPAS